VTTSFWTPQVFLLLPNLALYLLRFPLPVLLEYILNMVAD